MFLKERKYDLINVYKEVITMDKSLLTIRKVKPEDARGWVILHKSHYL